jgi:RNA polymerase sigma-70 factor (ECF subfamily)
MDTSADHLSRIKTLWTLQIQACQGQGSIVTTAQQQLLLRYHGAAYRYLLGMVRDPSVAEELAQDFAVRFLRGDFQQADPQRGRFRDFLKTALRHQAIDFWRRQTKERNEGPRTLPDADTPTAPEEPLLEDVDFLQGWREELLARTWEALASFQEESGVPYHTVLNCKTRQPDARTAALAAQVARRLGKPFSEGNFRTTLHRARQRFADLLLEEVARSLETDNTEHLEQELIELGLLDYCRSALERRSGDAGA